MASLMESRHRILLNTPHLETSSGSVAHFSTDMASKLKELKVNFLPQQVGSGDPSPSNVRAISGWTGVTVERCGKNLFDGNLENKNVNPNGAESADDSRLSSGFNPIKAGTYTISFDSNFSCALYVFASNQTGTQISSESHIYWNTSPLTFTIANGKYYRLKFKRNTLNTISPSDLTDVQLELGSESTEYEPYQSNQITVSWDNLGTIYGGYVDVLRGELVQEWVCETPNDNNWNIATSYTYQWGHSTIINIDASNYSHCICSHWKNNNYSNSKFAIINQNGAMFLGKDFWIACGMAEEDITNENIKQYLNNQALAGTPLQIAAKLATPITYPLTPETIKALKGINNVWSDAGDVSVKYWTH